MKYIFAFIFCLQGLFGNSQTPFVQGNNTRNNDVRRTDTGISNTIERLRSGYAQFSARNSFQLRYELQSELQAYDFSRTVKAEDSLLSNRIRRFDTLLSNAFKKDSTLRERKFESLLLRQKFKNKRIVADLQVESFRFQLDSFNSILQTFKSPLDSLDKMVKVRAWKEKKITSDADDELIYNHVVEMLMQTSNGTALIRTLTMQYDSLSKHCQYLARIRNSINEIEGMGMDEVSDSILARLLRAYDSSFNVIVSASNKFVNEEKLLRKELDIVMKSLFKSMRDIAFIYKFYKVSDDKPEENLKTLAGITQPIGESGKLVPNISVIGFKNVSSENSNASAQLKLFLGPGNNDKNTISTVYKLFIPEASQFGFMADFSWGFIESSKSFSVNKDTKQPVKKLGINLGAYYLSKGMVRPKDSSTYSVGMIQFKSGLQYVVIGRVLSIYANVNPFFFSDGVEQFQLNFNYDKKLKAFVDFGVNCYLDLAPAAKVSGLFLDFDLGFIVSGESVKSLLPTSDPLIPRIKISLVKGFAF
jgi:hypothetical protein